MSTLRTTWRQAKAHRAFGPLVFSIGLACLIVLPLFFPESDGFVDDCTLALAYVVMALGLNIIVGFAGLLDLGFVAFFAVGAYTVALLTSTAEYGLADWTFWQALPFAVLFAMLFGLFLGLPIGIRVALDGHRQPGFGDAIVEAARRYHLRRTGGDEDQSAAARLAARRPAAAQRRADQQPFLMHAAD